MKKTNIGGVILLLFLISVLSYDVCRAENIWQKRQQVLQDASETAKPETIRQEELVEESQPSAEIDETYTESEPQTTTNPFNIAIPAQYGTIIESNKGTDDTLIIHIQDAHANYEAQKNIAGIIESLVNNYGVKLILDEGNSTDKDYQYLIKEASNEARTRASEKLLKNAVITGIEYFTLTTEHNLSYQGIEDKPLYDQNKNALWEMDKFKDSALDYVNKMSLANNQLKPKIYNTDLSMLDNAKKDYDAENMDILAYYKILNDTAQKNKINIEEFPNFSNLIYINELEQKINIVNITSDKATDEEKALYNEYQEGLKNLNINKLFKEGAELEDKIISALFENPDQKTLFKVSKALSIMSNMLRVKLVPEEYTYFLQNKNDFNPDFWADFVKEKSDQLSLNLNIPTNTYSISDNLSKIEKFYGLAGEREKVFIRKTEERINKDNFDKAILVAGGFHTPQLTALLAEKGYSYVVISPKVTTPTDEALYRSALKND